MDDMIGQLLNLLDELNLSGNTLVYFTSDHGGQLELGRNGGSNKPFKGEASDQPFQPDSPMSKPRYLIYNDHFCKISDLKIMQFMEFMDQYFQLISITVTQAEHSKGKTIIVYPKIVRST
jgi:membrane-anchored protein YejM (alkaline phosphatase superfamily)